MATVIDSFTVASSSNIQMSLRSSSSSRTMMSPPISAVFRRSSLPEFSGLKIQRPSNPFLSSNLIYSRTQNKVSGRGGAIVCEASDTAVDVPSVTAETWKSLVLDADTPVMVEFWASWCGPCRMILPIIAELSKQYTGRLKCYKLNTDDCPTIATQYGIRSIPTIMIFVNGEKRDAVIGAVPKTTLTACIEKFL